MTNPGPLPGQRSAGDDDELAALLRDVLRRRASAVRPSPDGLERILAAARTGRDRRQEGLDNTLEIRPEIGQVKGAVLPERRRPLVVDDPLHRPDPPFLRWLPMLAAAAAVVILSAGLGLVQLRMTVPSGDTALVGGQAAAVASPYPPAAEPLPVYLVERQDERWALVREFTPTTLTDPAERLDAALRLAIHGLGSDPDHTSAWREAGVPTGSARELAVSSGPQSLVVRLPPALLGTDSPAGSLPPPGLAVQQLVWTATATAQQAVPVHVLGPAPDSLLFGSLRLNRAFTRDANDPRAPVWVSSLVDGQQLAAGRAVIRGDALVTDTGTVAWTLLGDGGTTQLAGGLAVLRQDDGDSPAPGERAVWEVILHLPTPGRYEFRVSQSWPEGGDADESAPRREGPPVWEDTKALVAG